MKLNLVNDLLNNIKENKTLQNFMDELSEFLEKENNKNSNKIIKQDVLKQEDCIYQVVEIGVDGAYLQNTNNDIVLKETEIEKETLDKIGEDTVLKFKNGKYVIDEELTKKFLNSLVDVQEYRKLQEDFIAKNDMSKIEINTKFKIEERKEEYSILSYGQDEKNKIKVPNALVPFWAKERDTVNYRNGKFIRIYRRK